ncbi:MAG: helix-turn-helix domain-containing protein [Clostridiales bacterium]|nr:helix-turn-helix domain-containing protein [Clostridiales bacterium]
MKEKKCPAEPDRENTALKKQQPVLKRQKTIDGYTGPRIKELLNTYHLTKYRLSQLSGVLPVNISRYVMGVRTPSLQTLEKICAGFGITLSEFFEDAGYQADPTLSDEQNSMLELLEGLDEEGKQHLLSYGKFLLYSQNEEV